MRYLGLLTLFLSVTVCANPTWKLTFSKSPMSIDDWLKHSHFKEQRGSADDWSVANGYLKMVQDEDSTTIGTSLRLNPYTSRYLRFEFMVNTLPKGANLRIKSKEDSAFRLFVLFDKGGGWFSPPNTLSYAYGTANKKGDLFASSHFSNIKVYVVAGGAKKLNQWIVCQRDLIEDYKKAFGTSTVPAIKAIGIKSDGNHLDVQAKARLRHISFWKKKK